MTTTDPIVRTLVVPRTPAEAFTLFTEEMGSWWPVRTHSRADAERGEVVDTVVFQGFAGGRIFERWTDGSERDWGRVTAWEPPERVVFDWKPNDEDRPFTEVEVRFVPTDDGGTQVTLEHRKWELLGPELGAEARKDYASEGGWTLVFERCFGVAAGIDEGA
jgi:uncharacterized protein YndB with AHSA1/START domain